MVWGKSSCINNIQYLAAAAAHFQHLPVRLHGFFFSNAALAAVIIILLPHESDAAVLRISFHDIYEKLGNTVI